MIKVDYDQIKSNLIKISKDNYLVLKSDAYGFGLKKVFQIANNLGFNKYAVLTLEDALYIKKTSQKNRVLLMGVFDLAELKTYQSNNIEITINSLDEVYKILNHNLNVQIAINTGMNRFGIATEELDDVWNKLRSSKNTILGIYSHSARNFDIEHKIFEDISLQYIIEKHFAASNKWINETRRIGVLIYENALRVCGKIIKVNYVQKNEYIGYGYHYQMKKDGYVGIIDLGYADGLERKCDGFMVFINGSFYELIGYACMNHTFVLLPNADFLYKEVEFIGKNNPIDNYVSFFDTIKHQIYTSFLKKD